MELTRRPNGKAVPAKGATATSAHARKALGGGGRAAAKPAKPGAKKTAVDHM